MKIFEKIMTALGILILFLTCAVFILSFLGKIPLARENISSIVFCALGISVLCYVPHDFVKLTESEKLSGETDSVKRKSLQLRICAGIIMIIVSVVKFVTKG